MSVFMVGARSRSRIPAFRLERPRTLEAACRLLASGDKAAICAGGIDLISRLKTGAGSDTARIVWIGAIAELQEVRRRDDRLDIGAAATHAGLATNAILRREFPELGDYMTGLGNVRIRAQGTIGGNLLAAEPAYEILPLLQVLDATLHAVDVGTLDPLTIPARTLGRGALRDFHGRLLVSISLPLRRLTLAWNRQMRPDLGIVAAWEKDARNIAGAAAMAGTAIEPAWAGFSGDVADAPQSWLEGLPPSTDGQGGDTFYCRRVAPVLLRRLLATNGAAA